MKTTSQSNVKVTFAYELDTGIDYRVYWSTERPDKLLRDLERNGIMVLQAVQDGETHTAVPMSVVEQVRVLSVS